MLLAGDVDPSSNPDSCKNKNPLDDATGVSLMPLSIHAVLASDPKYQMFC